MFELIIILSRYLFVFFILYFLTQGAFYILNERGIRETIGVAAISKQRICVVFLHISAVSILAFVPKTFSFDLQTLTIGGLGLVFLLSGYFLTSKVYKNSCPLLWNAMFFLMDVGLLMLIRIKPALASRQLLWFCVGMALLMLIPFILKFIPKFENLQIVYLIVGFLLLISPIVANVLSKFFPQISAQRTYGSLNWLEIGGFKFQPSELVKFFYIFYISSVFRKKQQFSGLIFPSIVSVIFVCVLVYQRDLGAALIFFMTYMTLLYISTGNIPLFLIGLVGASGASVLAYKYFPHIQVRISAWLNPFADIDDTGYQIARSLFAIGTWGIFGSGLTRGLPNSIPVVESDFIFSAISEEFGTIFAMCLLAVFVVIFYRGVHIALRCDRRFYSLLAAGFTSLIAFQTFLIVGGVTKFIPLTGVTLPFVSYGGSSVVVSMLMVGILQWIFIYNTGGTVKKRRRKVNEI